MRAVFFGYLLVLATAFVTPLGAQDYSVLRLNEVIAENRTQGPPDVGGGMPDIVEIFNSGTETLDLGFATKSASIGLSDTIEPPSELWTFRRGIRLEPGKSLIVYCDGNACEDECEPHASFRIDGDGSEPVTLWGPEDGDGRRVVIDRVWLPPLRGDVSFGRFPDGAGPTPVPVEETFDHFVFNPPGASTFGTSCVSIPDTECCLGQSHPDGSALQKRFCFGRTNGPGGNLEPRISLAAHSTNAPSAGEAVSFILEVRDDKTPLPDNVAAEMVYRVDDGPEHVVELRYDESTGVLPDLSGVEPGDPLFPGRPLDRRTLWEGEIPAQSAGAVVRFYFRVRDAEGLASTRPRDLCPFGVGPCDRNFGGNGCELDPDSTSCRNPDFDPRTDPPEEEFLLHGVRYFDCDAWLRYTVGHEPPESFGGLVVNEIMASQMETLKDPTSMDPSICGGMDAPGYCCGSDEPGCGFEDWIELHNASERPIDLSGTWMSDDFFDPEGWQFPPGSVIQPGDYLLVWMDGDGGECPDPDRPRDERPCFWDCPDPTDPVAGSYHASFRLDADGEQVFLFDTRANRFGRILGVEFDDQSPDISLSRCPDGSLEGELRATPNATPGASNDTSPGCMGPGVRFRRGDADGDCVVGVTDAILTLRWLFIDRQGLGCQDAADSDDNGTIELTDAIRTLRWRFVGDVLPPAPPGPDMSGPDPTPDDLPECVGPTCEDV